MSSRPKNPSPFLQATGLALLIATAIPATGCYTVANRTATVPTYEMRRPSADAPWQRVVTDRRTVKYREKKLNAPLTVVAVAVLVPLTVLAIASGADPGSFSGGGGGARTKPTPFDYTVDCRPTAADQTLPIDCSFQGVTGSGGVCGELELQCDGRPHRRQVCGFGLAAGERFSVRIGAVFPKPEPGSCRVIRFDSHPTCGGLVGTWLDQPDLEARRRFYLQMSRGCQRFLDAIYPAPLCGRPAAGNPPPAVARRCWQSRQRPTRVGDRCVELLIAWKAEKDLGAKTALYDQMPAWCRARVTRTRQAPAGSTR